ncbi:hypothetical protein HDU98_005092, partial [Podochytrium sp. JEL0797]
MKGLAVCISSTSSADFESALAKVASLHAKHGPFDFVVATGDFFAAPAANDALVDKLLSGLINVPTPLYTIAGPTPVPKRIQSHIDTHGEVAPNIFSLGPNGVFETSDGLSIAFHSSNMYTNQPVPAPFGVDILLTCSPPHNVAALSNLPQAGKVTTETSHGAAALCVAMKPRYHFASSPGVFFEREPFRNGRGVTRFVGLSEFSKASKERWFYAFNIVPMKKLDSAAVRAVPENATDSPLVVVGGVGQQGVKRGAGEMGDGNFFWGAGGDGKKGRVGKGGPPPATYTCNACHEPGHWIQECPKRQQRQAGRNGAMTNRDPGACWFCLSSPSLEKHLLVTIKEEVYIASTKGGLSAWGGHLIIVPIEHHSARVEILDKPVLVAEIESCQELIRERFEKEKGEVPVFFEVFPGHPKDSVKRMQHMHIQ